MEINQSILQYVKENLSPTSIRETNNLLHDKGSYLSHLFSNEEKYVYCMYRVPKVEIGKLELDEFQLYMIFQALISRKKREQNELRFQSKTSVYASKYEVETKRRTCDEAAQSIDKIDKDIEKVWLHLEDIVYERLKDTSIKEAYEKEPKLFKYRWGGVMDGWVMEFNYKKEIFIRNQVPNGGD